ncbi:hypothetical protein WR25_01359 [Diploscapter pachys]|uniref:Mob1/phocein family protein n=1 Tax=Diploscapter pachys TaxID=2018661 RepID=A0A2A2KVJ1_9BILA|nr:hypothetical protein WR25_01359 [Diploscapter pachys]
MMFSMQMPQHLSTDLARAKASSMDALCDSRHSFLCLLASSGLYGCSRGIWHMSHIKPSTAAVTRVGGVSREPSTCSSRIVSIPIIPSEYNRLSSPCAQKRSSQLLKSPLFNLSADSLTNAMSSFLDFLQVNKHKTFRPKKKFPQGSLRYSLHKQAEATLHSGVDLRAAVKLPNNESFDDWIAVHTVDFFNRINLMYGTIADVCTEESCPTMSGGPKYEYLWQDGIDYKKPTRLPAPRYMQLLMDWIEVRINDENIFPSCTTVPFPKDFRQTCKKILTRLFRVFVHIYIHHFDRLVELGAEPHANTLYKHFYFFITEHNMVSSKELEALKEMTERLLESGQNRRLRHM